MEAILNDIRIRMKQTYTRLVSLKKEQNQEIFNAELLKVLPLIYRYVSKRLDNAVANGKLNKGMFKPNDFTDQLFIEVYEHMDYINGANELRTFLFKTVDQLLEDSLLEEEFDHVFFENIDTYTKQEWDAMEEQYSRDGDGDFVMLEEMDDSSLNKENFTLDHIFISEEEKELAERIDASLNVDRVLNHVEFVLNKMDLPMRSVFELYVKQGFTLIEIADIREVSLAEVEEVLAKTREILRNSLEKRFLS